MVHEDVYPGIGAEQLQMRSTLLSLPEYIIELGKFSENLNILHHNFLKLLWMRVPFFPTVKEDKGVYHHRICVHQCYDASLSIYDFSCWVLLGTPMNMYSTYDLRHHIPHLYAASYLQFKVYPITRKNANILYLTIKCSFWISSFFGGLFFLHIYLVSLPVTPCARRASLHLILLIYGGAVL